MTRSKPYTMDSLERALAHHVNTGAIASYRRPTLERETWTIDLPQFGTVVLSTAQTYGICLGLAAGEKHAQRRLTGRVGAAVEFLKRRREENRRMPVQADTYHDGYGDGYSSGAMFAYQVGIKELELLIS